MAQRCVQSPRPCLPDQLQQPQKTVRSRHETSMAGFSAFLPPLLAVYNLGRQDGNRHARPLVARYQDTCCAAIHCTSHMQRYARRHPMQGQ